MVLDSLLAYFPHPPTFLSFSAEQHLQSSYLVVLLQGKGKVTIVLSINFDTCLRRLINYF